MEASGSARPQLKRIDKALADGGYCSRKEAFQLARQGRITVNGIVVKDSSTKVQPADIELDGERLDHPDGILVMLNKPLGYVCSHDRSEGPRVFDLLPEQWMSRNPRPVAVGRLDKDTTGLLLITDLTRLVHDMTSPRRHVEKIYEVTVDRPLDSALIELFQSGELLLDDDEKPCLPAQLTILDETFCTLVLHEGRYHQVRRMFASQGYTVTRLHRTTFGPYRLEGLAEGEYRDVPILVP